MPLRIPDKLMREAPAALAGPDNVAFAVTAGFGCAAAVRPPWDFAAPRTSVSVTLPSGPVPFTPARSMPSSAASRRATGEAFTRASSVDDLTPVPGLAAGFAGDLVAASF